MKLKKREKIRTVQEAAISRIAFSEKNGTRLTELLDESNNRNLKNSLSMLRAEIRQKIGSLGENDVLDPICERIREGISDLIDRNSNDEVFILLAEEALVYQLGIKKGYTFTEPTGKDDFVKCISQVREMALMEENLEKAIEFIDEQFEAIFKVAPVGLEAIFEKRKEAMIHEVKSAFKDS